MANIAADSSSAGYLRASSAPPYDRALEDVFQGLIVGLTGIPGNLVRPRNQPDPPPQPGFDVDWCAFNVFVERKMWNAYTRTLADGSYTVEGQETIRLAASFYGPSFDASESAMRDGMQVGQNRDDLTAAGIAFVEFADTAFVPALLKQQWVLKADVRATFHRWAVRTYAVRTLVAADVDINNEYYHTLVSVTSATKPTL